MTFPRHAYHRLFILGTPRGIIYFTLHTHEIVGSDGPGLESEAVGAPDIVITDEMTRAGIDAFQRFHPGEDDLEWIVSAVFDAVFRRSPQRP
jgi:hypothetical protein